MLQGGTSKALTRMPSEAPTKTHPVNVKSYSCFSLRILAWESLPSQLQWSRFTGKQERRRFKDGKRKDVKNHKEAESWALERRWWGFFDRNSLAGTEGERERWKGKDRECEILWWPLWLMVFQRGSAEIFNLFKQKRCSRCSTHGACDNYIFGALWATAKCIQCSHRLPTAFIPLPPPCLTAVAEGFITCGCAIYIEQDKEGGLDLYLEVESESEMEFWK